MRNAFAAFVITMLAAIGSAIGADPIVTSLSILAAIGRIGYAFRHRHPPIAADVLDNKYLTSD